MKSKTFRRSQSGLTILEVLVSTFILGIISIASAGMLGIFNTDLSRMSTNSTKSDIQANFRIHSKNVVSLYNSAQQKQNPELQNCLQGTGTTACKAQEETEFVFYGTSLVSAKDANGIEYTDQDSNSIMGPEPMAGVSDLTCSNDNTKKVPVFYTPDGRRCACNEPADVCPFQAISKFTAYCSSGTVCTTASAFQVSYTLRPRPDLTNTNSHVANMRTINSHSTINIASSDELFVKFIYAQSIYTNATGNKQASGGSVSEFDISQSTPLSFVKGSVIHLNVAFAAPAKIGKLELYQYKYPQGCLPSNIGTTVTIGAVSVNCMPPTASDFELMPLSQPAIETPEYAMTVALGKVPGHPDILGNEYQTYEYKAMIYNLDNVKVAETTKTLIATFLDLPTLSVTPPTTFWAACDPNFAGNIFTFQAVSQIGWKEGSLKATITRMGVAGAPVVPFPDFEQFSPTNQNAQSIALLPAGFVEGASYVVTFQGTTKNDILVNAPPMTFTVKTRPSYSIAVSAPASGVSVRTISPLNTSTTVNLKCGESPSAVKLGVKDTWTLATVMADVDISSSCVSNTATNAPDQNAFTCAKSFTCDKWLNVTDATLCSTMYPNSTQLNATATMKPADNVTRTSTRMFITSSKISVKIKAANIAWTHVTSDGPPALSMAGKSAPVPLVFASNLMAGESASFKLVGTTASYTFTCASSTSCSGSIPSPGVDDTFTLESLSPDLVIIGEPKKVTFKYVGEPVLTCSSASAGFSCPSGQTFKRKLDTIGPYDYSWNTTGGGNIGNYSLLNPAYSAVDFFLTYLPTSSTLPDFSVVFNVAMNSGVPGSSVGLAGNLQVVTTASCSADMTSCPGDLAHVPASAFASYFPIIGDKTFSIGLQSKNFTGAVVTSGYPGVMIIRQCYCQ
ncbi:MAG: type IV pilus modification PilV family protein [Pseudobdellovibrionaceae bacterium]